MAHYEIGYKNLDAEETKRKALQDCREWLGASGYKEVAKIIRQAKGKASKNLIVWALGMRGIQGYPAEVMVDHYWQ